MRSKEEILNNEDEQTRTETDVLVEVLVDIRDILYKMIK
jgi:hypothetical protein